MALKVGERAWSAKELTSYFSLRLKESQFDERPHETLKKVFLKELVLISLMEAWAKDKKLQIKKSNPDQKKRDFKEVRAENFSLLQELLRKELLKEIPKPSSKEQRDFFKKNSKLFDLPPRCHLDQILVKEKSTARTLRKKLREGASFSKLKSQSLKPGPFWVTKGSVAVFDRACWKEKGKITPVLKSPYGYHIFLIKQKKPGKKLSFTEAKSKIVRLIQAEKVETSLETWLKEELSKTAVWTNEAFLDSLHIQ